MTTQRGVASPDESEGLKAPIVRAGVVQVRHGQPADLPGLVRCWRSLMRHHQAIDPLYFAEGEHAESQYTAYALRCMRESLSMALVAQIVGDPDQDEQEIVGYLTAARAWRAPHFAVREVAVIHDLAVLPQARGRGVGRALFEDACARFREKGLAHMLVSYAPENTLARQFWTRQGFNPMLMEGVRAL